MDADDWLRTKEAANYLADLGCFFSARTLTNLRNNNNAGKGPPFTRSHLKTIRYLKSDLEEWARKRVVRIE